MENINKDFKDLWRRSNLQSENIVDLILVLVLWRYLSDVTYTGHSDNYKWNDPGNNYHFNSLNNPGDSKSISFFGLALKKWCELNDRLDSIFYIDERNLNIDTVFSAWILVKNITSDLTPPNRWNKEHTKSLFDKIASFFLNDWRLSHEYFTPTDVSMVMVGLVKGTGDVTIYDPSCGSGDLLHAALIDLPNASRVTGVTQNSFIYKFAQIRLLLLDIPFDLFHDNDKVKDEKFDIILTNPPFGMKNNFQNNIIRNGKWSELQTTKRSEARYLKGILENLSEKGKAVVILPNGILSEKANSILRKEMVEENLVEAIIHLPKNIFHHTRVSASLLLLNKQKDHKDFLFIDASNLGIKDRDGVRLTDNGVRFILELFYSDKQGISQASKYKVIKVGLDLLRKKEYDLQYITYDKSIEYVKPRPSIELLNEFKILEVELANIQKEISGIII